MFYQYGYTRKNDIYIEIHRIPKYNRLYKLISIYSIH